MANISIRDALELPELQSLEVLAGESGLDREIRDVTVLEVPEPVHWLKGGELILTAFYGIRDDEAAQVNLLIKLAPLVAGVCFNPGTGTILTSETIKVAEELSLPLLRMPGDMPYARVIRAVLQAILNRQAYLLGRSTEINSLMINAILNGAESKEVVATLAQLVKSPVVLLDASLNVVNEEPYFEGGQEFIKNGMPQLLTRENFHNTRLAGEHPSYAFLIIKDQQFRVAVKPVMIKSSIFGYLTIWEILKKFDEVDIYAIAHASTAIALDFIRSINLAEQRQKMFNNICEVLLSGNFVSQDAIVKQGEMYGLNLAHLNVVIVIQTDFSGEKISEPYQAPGTPGKREEMVASLRKLLDSSFKDSFVAVKNSDIIISLDSGEIDFRKKRLTDLVKQIACTCERFIGKEYFTLGVGSHVDSFVNLAQSYSQAQAALKMIRYFANGERTVFFDDLGIYRLLCEIPHTPEVENYIDMVLPGADKQDKSMLETLEVFIECQKSFTAAAKVLYVHPNTVKYRLNKAKEVWGENIVLENHCLDTLIALKLKKFINGDLRI